MRFFLAATALMLAGCNAEDARSAVAALARCHALWWRNPRLEAFGWLPATNDPINHFAQFAYQGCWEPFVQFVGEKMTPALRRTGEALATNVIRMLDDANARATAPAPRATAPVR